MIVDILALALASLSLLFACAFVAGARTTAAAPTNATTTPAVPKAKDQRPLWAQAPMVDHVAPRCTAWENEEARLASRLDREAQAWRRAQARHQEEEEVRLLQAQARREAQARKAFDQEWEAANTRHRFHGSKPWWAQPISTPHVLKSRGRRR